MTYTYSSLLEVLGKVLQKIESENRYPVAHEKADLSLLKIDNLIDKISKALQDEDPDLHKAWINVNCDVNYDFHHCMHEGRDCTLLHAAASKKLLMVTGALLTCGAKDNQGAIFALVVQSCYGDICKSMVAAFISERGNVDALDKHGSALLHIASRYYGSSTVNALIYQGANVNVPDRCGQTPLHIAIENSTETIINILIDRGANVNVPDRYGQTPLHIAIENSTETIINILIDRGANVHAIDKYAMNPLHIAVQHSNISLINVLIARNANVHLQQNESMYTPLHTACSKGDIKAIMALVNKGHAFLLKDLQNRTPDVLISLSYTRKKVERLFEKAKEQYVVECKYIREFLAKIYFYIITRSTRKISLNGRRIPLNGNFESLYEITTSLSLLDLGESFRKLVTNEVLVIMKPYLSSLSDVQIVNLVSYAARYLTESQCKEIVNALLKGRVNVNMRDDHHRSLLHVVVEHGYESIAKILVDRGADVSAMDKYAMTPLHIAVRCKNISLINVLIARNANVHLQDENMHTPLHTACINQDMETIMALVNKGHAFLLKDQEDNTPDLASHDTRKKVEKLFEKVKDRYVVECKYIRKFLAEIYYHIIKRSTRRIPLTGDFDSLCEITTSLSLLDLGETFRKLVTTEVLVIMQPYLSSLSDVQIVNLVSYAARYLTESNCRRIVNALLEGRVNVNIKDDHNRSLLHVVLEHGYESIADILIAKGVDVDSAQRDGSTPLHVAAMSSCIPQSLLDRANPLLKDENGKTPRNLALTGEIISKLIGCEVSWKFKPSPLTKKDSPLTKKAPTLTKKNPPLTKKDSPLTKKAPTLTKKDPPLTKKEIKFWTGDSFTVRLSCYFFVSFFVLGLCSSFHQNGRFIINQKAVIYSVVGAVITTAAVMATLIILTPILPRKLYSRIYEVKSEQAGCDKSK